nr:anthranilate synthase alpha subunit 2, chloroplastic-like [Ziziphus jujuba var. spinosa]
METLAPQLPSTFCLPSTIHVTFNRRGSRSMALVGPTSLARRVRCSAVSSPLIVDQSEQFVTASKKGNLIPLYQTLFSDHLTPVLAYRCLVKEDDRDAPSFLFESVEPGTEASSMGRL